MSMMSLPAWRYESLSELMVPKRYGGRRSIRWLNWTKSSDMIRLNKQLGLKDIGESDDRFPDHTAQGDSLSLFSPDVGNFLWITRYFRNNTSHRDAPGVEGVLAPAGEFYGLQRPTA